MAIKKAGKPAKKGAKLSAKQVKGVKNTSLKLAPVPGDYYKIHMES